MEQPTSAWDSVYCLRPYHPHKVNGERNPEFDRDLDGRLLDFKDGQDYAIRAETRLFRAALATITLPEHTMVAVVPGHIAKATNVDAPLAIVAAGLAAGDRRLVAAPDAILRRVTIPRLASGGLRSLEAHLSSMELGAALDLRGATILLIDDLVTTARSIEACRRLLLRAGAAEIAAIALARTVRRSDGRAA